MSAPSSRSSSRFLSAAVVAAVATVGAAALVDALRGPGVEPASVPAEIRGELVYSDAGCRRHSIRLPDLARRSFLTVGCGVFTRTDNLGVKDGDVAWFAYPVPGGTTTLLRRDQLPSGLRVREAVWLRGRRFAAVLVPGGMLTIWEGARLLRVVLRGAQLRELRASPNARYFAGLAGGGLVVFDRHGRPLDLPRGSAIAWSPDERFAAIALGDEIAFVPADGGDPVARIPVSAVDLDWRSS
jgi:hypothetical protein